MEPMLTRQELAARLHVSVDTVDRETAKGTWRVHRVGRSPRYVWSEIVADTAEASMTDGAAVARALRSVG